MDKTNSIQLGVGAIVFKDDAVLLVKRKNPPNQNQWAIPGGKVRYGEPLKKAVERELLEETGITIKARKPVFTFEIIEADASQETPFHYVVIDFSAEYLSGEPFARDDAEEASWVSRSDFSSLDINPITTSLLKEKFNFP